MHQQSVPEHHSMNMRTFMRRAAWWVMTGFLLCLAVSIITQLTTHHSGETAAQITGAVYLALTGVATLLRISRRRPGSTWA